MKYSKSIPTFLLGLFSIGIMGFPDCDATSNCDNGMRAKGADHSACLVGLDIGIRSKGVADAIAECNNATAGQSPVFQVTKFGAKAPITTIISDPARSCKVGAISKMYEIANHAGQTTDIIQKISNSSETRELFTDVVPSSNQKNAAEWERLAASLQAMRGPRF